MIVQVLDHLWQSTLLALAVALLVLTLRKASASIRHGLWFAASVKFLVPFAALAALGRLLAPAGFFPARAAPDAAILEQAVLQPLSRFPFAHDAALQAPLAPSAPPHAPLVPAPESVAHTAPHLDLALILLALWVLGSTAVLVAWAIRWARVRKVVRGARPIAWTAPMPVLASPLLMEPGLIGFLRPVLVVPETLPEHLSPAEIDAILAHEACHLRRRDNLTAAAHMVVEALFWFHPLVWWIGALMIAERERACDEAVVRSGHDRAAYARSLVESCRFYLQSPLSCVAGASGSDLKTRVEMIMTASPSSPLTPLKKALLLAAGACAFATPVAAGPLTSPEARKAAVRAAAAVSNALDAPAIRSAPEAGEGAGLVQLARNQVVVAPALSVAQLDTPRTPLSRDIAAPVAVAPPPVQAAVAAPPSARPSPASAAPPTDLAEIRRQAADFVQSYGDFTSGGFARSHQTGRWSGALCVAVQGIPLEEEDALRTRIEEVAKSIDVTVQPADCDHANLLIAFANDGQAALDRFIKHDARILGDRTSDTREVRTVTLPIQAWYVTNGATFAQNDRNQTNGLKVRVLYQSPSNPSGMPSGSFTGGLGSSAGPFGASGPFGGHGGGYGGGICCAAPSAPAPALSVGVRAFTNVMVIVDLSKTRNRSLGVLADYVTMLALSEPRALGRCNVLPSITDLFASCPGRPAPDGLTPADAAYLTALYPRKGAGIQYGDESLVAQRMAEILSKAAG